jgi:hypothetical protein
MFQFWSCLIILNASNSYKDFFVLVEQLRRLKKLHDRLYQADKWFLWKTVRRILALHGLESHVEHITIFYQHTTSNILTLPRRKTVSHKNGQFDDRRLSKRGIRSKFWCWTRTRTIYKFLSPQKLVIPTDECYPNSKEAQFPAIEPVLRTGAELLLKSCWVVAIWRLCWAGKVYDVLNNGFWSVWQCSDIFKGQMSFSTLFKLSYHRSLSGTLFSKYHFGLRNANGVNFID